MKFRWKNVWCLPGFEPGTHCMLRRQNLSWEFKSVVYLFWHLPSWYLKRYLQVTTPGFDGIFGSHVNPLFSTRLFHTTLVWSQKLVQFTWQLTPWFRLPWFTILIWLNLSTDLADYRMQTVSVFDLRLPGSAKLKPNSALTLRTEGFEVWNFPQNFGRKQKCYYQRTHW